MSLATGRSTMIPPTMGSVPRSSSRASPEMIGRGSPALGVTILATIALGNIALWVAARPGGQPSGRYIGELCGVEAVVLLACALVLMTLIPAIEVAFGGLDRVTVWHRRVATGAALLLVPHVLLATSPADPFITPVGQRLGDLALIGLLFLAVWALAPRLRAARWPGLIRRMARATYERWLTAHRLTGLFVAAAVAHAAIVDPILHRSTVLRVAFFLIGGIGIAAYAYRELLARYVIPIYDYNVGGVARLNKSTLEVTLDPTGRSPSFAAGQFVFLAFGGFDGWQRHPFTVASAPEQQQLAVTIKAAGDYTGELYERLRPGVPAKISGPFGGFDFRRGGHDQIWIAGGIGITPFMSWIRALDGTFDRDVDFYYAVGRAADAVYLDEIQATAKRHPSLRLHLVCSESQGLLTAEDVMRSAPAGAKPWVYMCGPPSMMTTFAKDLRRLGVPDSHIRWEQFSLR
jgi:predicted ferric reductase